MIVELMTRLIIIFRVLLVNEQLDDVRFIPKIEIVQIGVLLMIKSDGMVKIKEGLFPKGWDKTKLKEKVAEDNIEVDDNERTPFELLNNAALAIILALSSR